MSDEAHCTSEDRWCDSCPWRCRFCPGIDYPDRCGEISGDPTAAAGPRPATPPPALAGDLVAGLAHRIGADRAADWVARQVLGIPDCNCAARQAALNALDAKVRRFLGWG